MSGTAKIDLSLNETYPGGGLLNIDIFGTDIYTIFFSIFFFSLSILIILQLSKSKIIKFERSLLIFSFHSIFSALFIWALMTLIVNDIDTYFQIGLIYPDDGYFENYNLQTWGILTISEFYRIFYYFFKLDFLSINIFFGCLGSFVLIFYDKLLLENLQSQQSKKDIRYYFPLLIIFFPSLSIWTGYLGKEILTITILISAAYILIKEKNLFLASLFVLPFIGLLNLIRPHFAYMFILSFIIYLILKILKKNRFKYLILFISLFFLLVFGQYFFIGGEFDFNIKSFLDKFFEAGSKQRKYFIPTSEWNLPQVENSFYLWISFLFSPILDLGNPRDIFLSLENITLISTLLFLFFNTDLKKLIENDEAKFFIIFFIISSFVMSIFTFQTGIYWRQKWLLLPYLFLGMSMIQKKNLFNVKK